MVTHQDCLQIGQENFVPLIQEVGLFVQLLTQSAGLYLNTFSSLSPYVLLPWARCGDIFSMDRACRIIDDRVGLILLYDTVVACAGYQQECCTNHSIPLVEMFSKFKMIFKLLNNDWEDYTEEVRHKIEANCAIETINKTVQAREAD